MRWFKHDTEAFGDSAIQMMVAVYGIEGYAHYWMLVEQTYKDGPILDLSDDDIRQVTAARHGWSDEELCAYIDKCVKFGLFDSKEWRRRKLTSNRICKSTEDYEHLSDVRSKAARQRWKQGANANAMQ